MLYAASVRDSDTNEILIITRDYPSKKAFYSDLRGNGYRVRIIAKAEEFDDEAIKVHERYETQKRVRKYIYAARKESATRLGMTMKEFEEYLKG